MRTNLKIFILCIVAVVITSCSSNQTAHDPDHDSILSGSLNIPDSTKNDTLTNTGATNIPDATTDSTRRANDKP